jgi:Na+/H+ antiporter NhaD/arsenite permease-like protein
VIHALSLLIVSPVVTLSVTVFILVYIGMALGRVPGLAVDRTGVALLGLIVLLASGDLSLDEAGRAVDMPTLALLFALMILSAQFEQSGFYGYVAAHVTNAARNPRLLLAVLIAVTGLLSAILTNDVIAFAFTPLICVGLLRQELDPRPYLVALAGAANAGSALTLIGNPQNILIGQAGGLDFWRYIAIAVPPVIVSLAFVYIAVAMTWKASLTASGSAMPHAEPVILDRFQTAKGLIAIVALIVLFLTPLPRELGALAVAGVLLLSRRLSSREMIGAVDWHLLLLFTCLFGVTAAFAKTGLAQDGLQWLAASGFLPQSLTVMLPVTLASSNTIGNVPAVILILRLLPDLPDGVLSGLALLSTFAGNLLLTGSLCNIIVAERAQASGARLAFADFARSGIPMTLASLLATALWLWAIGYMPL